MIGLDTDGLPIINTNFSSLLNALGPSEEFTDYDVPGDQGTTTLENGDDFSMRYVDPGSGDITTVDQGTYTGDFTLSTASVTANLALATATVTLNPIEGELYQDENGDFFMITDEPLDEDHLGLTIEIDPLVGSPTSIDLNLSDPLGGVPVVGDAVAPLVQQVLDTAVVTFEADVDGTLTFDDGFVPCFVRGTIIMTDRGSVPVENLQVGDRVITRDNGYQEIRWIGSATVDTGRLRRNENLRPIRIKANALKNGVPSEDLTVSPQHRILLSSKIAFKMFQMNEILVAAKKLLSFEGVERVDDLKEVEYFHFMMDKHEVVYSNSAPTETLFIGQQALIAIDDEAREEIFSLFPELRNPECRPTPARMIVEGKKLKRFIYRHAKNQKPLVSEMEKS